KTSPASCSETADDASGTASSLGELQIPLLALVDCVITRADCQCHHQLRVREGGHVVVNSSMDRLWPPYFCCMAYANREFVRTHPVATKRVLYVVLRPDSPYNPPRIPRGRILRSSSALSSLLRM